MTTPSGLICGTLILSIHGRAFNECWHADALDPSTAMERPVMNRRNSVSRYGSLSIGLHWVMLLLLAAVCACMELRGNFPKGSDIREGLKTWHFMLGLSVLVLVSVRMVARFFGTAPDIQPAIPKWQNAVAKLMQLALYALMFGMPILGWLILSADGRPIPFFGLQLPPLIGESSAIAEWAEEIHEIGGAVGYVLVGLHAAAALAHHYVLNDNTLRGMLPGRG